MLTIQKQNSCLCECARGRECPFFSSTQGEHRRLGGDLRDDGFSFEWHNWNAREGVEWSKTDPAASVELYLNIDGIGQIGCAGVQAEQHPMSAGFCCRTECPLWGTRRAGKHRFLIVELAGEFLAEALNRPDASIHPSIQRFLAGDSQSSGAISIGPLSSGQQEFVLGLRHPAVSDRAKRLWYRGKALEAIAEFLFPRPEEMFCTRQRRLAKERVDRVLRILRRDLSETPSLEELGRQAGCSPFHLSRTFSKEMGMSIPQFLRRLRMEKAAELLASGKFNVTETAMEVGYSSVSHFSQAFCQAIGCCPNLYPQAKPR